MDSSVLLTLCLVGALVVGINGLLFLTLRRNNRGAEIQLFRAAFTRAKAPWQTEDSNLKELSKLVDELNRDKNEESKN